MENKEIWVPAKYINNDGMVLDFAGLYEVSNYGRVKSLNYRCTGKAKVLSLGTSKVKDGSILYTVALCKDCKKYFKNVHRLVLSSFNMEGWFENADVDHIIARTSTNCNNCLDNLRWVTRQQNNSTDHCRELLINRKQSKRVKVTDLSTGEVTEYPSAMEAGRSLGMPHVSSVIRKQNGYYKKSNLHFEYVL